MRDELESLKAMVEPKALKTVNTKKATLILKEPKNDGTDKLSQVTLYNVPNETVVFTLDLPKFRMSGYLAEKKGGWNRGCDYVIATHDGKTGWLLLCEMKSGSTPSGFVPQLQSGDAFMRYLEALVTYFGRGSLSSFQRRHVLFHQAPPLEKKSPFGGGKLTVKGTESLNLIKVNRNVLQLSELFVEA